MNHKFFLWEPIGTYQTAQEAIDACESVAAYFDYMYKKKVTTFVVPLENVFDMKQKLHFGSMLYVTR